MTEAVLERASTKEILTWAQMQPWARAMADCIQDAEWHAEGDAYAHAKPVFRRHRLTRIRQNVQ